MNCLQVEAITILENERSYANILLGEYGVPEVLLIPKRFKNISFLRIIRAVDEFVILYAGLFAKVFAIQLRRLLLGHSLY